MIKKISCRVINSISPGGDDRSARQRGGKSKEGQQVTYWAFANALRVVSKPMHVGRSLDVRA